MKLEFTLTLADFKAAFRLHRRQTLVRRMGAFAWPILTVVCFGVALFSNPKSELFAQTFALGVGCLWLTVFLPIARRIIVFRSFRRVVPNGLHQQRCFATVDDQHVVTGVQGLFELNYYWKGVTGFAQDKRMTLFYTSKCSFLFFPTNALSSEQFAELNGIVSRNMIRRKQ